MADKADEALPKRFSLKDVSGTTLAMTSLAILAAGAVVTTPVWLWYRRKRKRTDALLRSATGERAQSQEPGTENRESAAKAEEDR